jgi:hypothetical protein
LASLGSAATGAGAGAGLLTKMLTAKPAVPVAASQPEQAAQSAEAKPA